MNESVQEYIDKYPDEVKELYIRLRTIIYDSVSYEIEEKLWAKIPSYYVGESFVRLIPFKDHVNVEAAAVLAHREELGGYKITPKGMLQIYLKQDVLQDVLGKIFVETLDGMPVCN
ncbi:MAG: DUF1801 domain-containing protein [Lachnospiraceae bacterium]|nr:DUF1801 domain-containing protein [Lachnospiraceae bacterium]MDE7132220.1 DUF1801 domain-containing protein [Lachnospiraceae bacterium]